MKYTYKTISTKGFDIFNDSYENLVRDYELDQKGAPAGMFSIKRMINENPEGFSYIKNLSKKYGNTPADYLNYFGMQGWKVISYDSDKLTYLIMKEENTPAEKLDSIPEIKEGDLKLKEYNVSFISDNEKIEISDPLKVNDGYLLTSKDLIEKSTNPYYKTVYKVADKRIYPGYKIRQDTVISISLEVVERNFQLCF